MQKRRTKTSSSKRRPRVPWSRRFSRSPVGPDLEDKEKRWSFVDEKLPSFWSAFALKNAQRRYVAIATQVLEEHFAMDVAGSIVNSKDFRAYTPRARRSRRRPEAAK